MKIPLHLMLQAKAIQQLRPDLGPRMIAGEMTVEDAMPDTYRAYIQLVMEEARLRAVTDPAKCDAA